MSIYYARHGQTEWNLQGRLCGRADIPLTGEGREQARLLAKSLLDKNLDLVITSPLMRARETGQAVADLCHVPIREDARLIEMDFGTCDGADAQDPVFRFHKTQFVLGFPEGETWMQVAARAYALIGEVREQYAGKNVLLLTHGCVSAVIYSYSHRITNEAFLNFMLPNASFAKLDD